MPITIHDLRKVEAEMKRFLARSEECRKALAMWGATDDRALVIGTRQTGAVRRASMDLTRALADLRRAK